VTTTCLPLGALVACTLWIVPPPQPGRDPFGSRATSLAYAPAAGASASNVKFRNFDSLVSKSAYLSSNMSDQILCHEGSRTTQTCTGGRPLLESARAHTPRPATAGTVVAVSNWWSCVCFCGWGRLGCPGGGGWACRFGSPCTDFHPAGVATQRLGRAGGATVADGALPPRTARAAGAIHPPATGKRLLRQLSLAWWDGDESHRRSPLVHPHSRLRASPHVHICRPPPTLLPPLPRLGSISTRLVLRLVSHHGVRRD